MPGSGSDQAATTVSERSPRNLKLRVVSDVNEVIWRLTRKLNKKKKTMFGCLWATGESKLTTTGLSPDALVVSM
jgi:hypothetical protein